MFVDRFFFYLLYLYRIKEIVSFGEKMGRREEWSRKTLIFIIITF